MVDCKGVECKVADRKADCVVVVEWTAWGWWGARLWTAGGWWTAWGKVVLEST